MEALEKKESTDTLKPTLGAWSEREKMVVDLSEVYKGASESEPLWPLVLTGTSEDLICTKTSSTGAAEQVDMESVYQTLERMPHLWQRAEYPLETILTTYVCYILFLCCYTKVSSVVILLLPLVQNPVAHRDPAS